jgi:DNA repair protein RadD
VTGLFTPPADPRELWEHQAGAIEILGAALLTGARRPLLQLPTGAGKTRIAAEIIRRHAVDNGQRAIFVVPRLVLIEQTVAAFEREGIAHIGVIQGQNFRTDARAPVQIASADTLVRREIQKADVVFIDEAHIKRNKIQNWMALPEWAHVPFVGLTATPWSRGLGRIYDRLLRPISLAELIDKGRLSKFRVFAPPPPDLEAVRTANDGEFHEGDLAEACNEEGLVADVIKTWLEKGENRPTLCYGVDRKHAQHLQERFREAGVAAEYIDCDTPLYEREEIFERFHESRTKVICNVATCDTGLDLDIRCISDARPTRSRIRFVQTIGRGLRLAEGKDHLIILDHAGNHERLGLVTDIDFPHLDDGSAQIVREKAKCAKAPNIKLCPECRCILPPRARECPACGFQILADTPIIERPGELVELGEEARSYQGGPTIQEQAIFYAMLQGYRARLKPHYKPTWASCQFRDKYGFWPNDWRVRNVEPIPPDLKTLN